LERAYTQISHHPASGSLRYAQELSIPGLRVLKLAGCPQLVFYLERGNYIDVWRVLHGQRDIPTWMQAPEEP
jgi:toxin ParE1/3/4